MAPVTSWTPIRGKAEVGSGKKETHVKAEQLLKIQDLKVHFFTLRGVVHALDRVSFYLNRQETLGLASTHLKAAWV